MYPVSFILYHLSCILCLSSCIICLVSCIFHLVFCILYFVSCILYPVSQILYSTSYFLYPFPFSFPFQIKSLYLVFFPISFVLYSQVFPPFLFLESTQIFFSLESTQICFLFLESTQIGFLFLESTCVANTYSITIYLRRIYPGLTRTNFSNSKGHSGNILTRINSQALNDSQVKFSLVLKNTQSN